MVNKTISFESDFEGQVMSIVSDKLGNWSNQTLISSFKKNEFEEILNNHLTISEKLVKNDKYISLKTKEFFSLYEYNCVISDDCIIGYNSIKKSIQKSIDDQTDKIDTIYDDDDEYYDVTVNVNDIDIPKEDIEIVTDVFMYYNHKNQDLIDKITNEIEKTVFIEPEKGVFYTIGMSNSGFKLNSQEITPVNTNIELHYGKDFVKLNDEILNNLKTKYHGLLLFHGVTGSGKTSYIRYLISELCKDKKIIYVPTSMIEQIAYPEFITFLQNQKESILILEDAEYALQSRSNEVGAQAVSNLLNLTNGLLNDACKIQVIATFNMDKKKIDTALTRPGRLLNEWKFDKLNVEDSKALVEFLNSDFVVTGPSTVAEIYAGKLQEIKGTKKIGF